jgi:undecaprenyl diphosphate synthase
VVEAGAQIGLQALTLYAFSVENWKRPRHEIEGLWRLLRYYLRREVPELMRNNVRLVAIGGLRSLPANVQNELESAMQTTGQNTGMRLNLAINYGGRTEIVDAVNSILADARKSGTGTIPSITEDMLAGRLYTAGLCDPDLLIRTSGEMRISNFLLWQIAYAEIHVTDTLWPDFTVTDLLRALQDFQSRDRRFGGLTAAAQSSAEKGSLGDPLPFDDDSSSVIREEPAEQPVA